MPIENAFLQRHFLVQNHTDATKSKSKRYEMPHSKLQVASLNSIVKIFSRIRAKPTVLIISEIYLFECEAASISIEIYYLVHLPTVYTSQ